MEIRVGSKTEMREAGLPPGWSYNPSAWKERRVFLALAVIGLLAAAYTSAAQLSIIPAMWDPIFGSASSYAVTHSAISRLLPFPDGVLGVFGYLIFGSLGDRERWRTAPWAALIFALVITGLGIVSLALTIAQGTIIRHWCSVCLVSALVSTLIFGLGIGEALASLQYLSRAHARGRSLWSALLGRSEQQRAEDVDFSRFTEKGQRLPTYGS